MAWDDEVERLTREVTARWSADAVGGAYLGALVDVQRDGGLCVPPDWLKRAAAGRDFRFYAGDAFLRAYKARLRELLFTTH